MIIEPIYLLYGAIFLAALLLVEGLYLLYQDTRGGSSAVNRRMSMLATGKDSQQVFEHLRRRPTARAERLGIFGGWFVRFDRLIAQSGLTISTGRMLLIMLGLMLSCFLFLLYFTNAGRLPGQPAAIVGWVLLSLLAGVLVPIVYLNYLRSNRIKQFSEQLPDALDIMVRSLQAGHPISAAIGLVSKEMNDPIGTEFGIAVDEMTYGLDMREALYNMGRRIEIQDFEYVVVSINIQHDTGGNLAEVLNNLSVVIRDRFRMFKKIRALSSEGRLSAIVLSFLPFGVGAIIFTGNPGFYLNVADDPLFLPMMGGALGLMLVGIFIMYRMVNFRV
jgi:tight adherence protein B